MVPNITEDLKSSIFSIYEVQFLVNLKCTYFSSLILRVTSSKCCYYCRNWSRN